MSVAVVTGASGLVGSATVKRLHDEGLTVIGIDNDMRARFFGEGASTRATAERLAARYPDYEHLDADIRDSAAMDALFARLGRSVSLVVHAAAQPSHDWAARDPHLDFAINATSTITLLELTRVHCPEAVFIFTSTNKVYGDRPNRLHFDEMETRWTPREDRTIARWGIDETMPIDQCLHSLFGASKLAADVMVQEYAHYYGLKAGIFRGGCLTGPDHAGAELHGFLAYLMKCAVLGRPYTVYGHKAKQVRDNIHSDDLVDAFWRFFRQPRPGEVYNIGGGPEVNCSMLEAIALCEEISGRALNWTYNEEARKGDHIWWVSDLRKYRAHYPDWQLHYDLKSTLGEIHDSLVS